jgi:hypothetical protein
MLWCVDPVIFLPVHFIFSASPADVIRESEKPCFCFSRAHTAPRLLVGKPHVHGRCCLKGGGPTVLRAETRLQPPQAEGLGWNCGEMQKREETRHLRYGWD